MEKSAVLPTLASDPPVNPAHAQPLPPFRGADEMRKYVAEQRGTPLIRVGSIWMFGSGNW